MSIENDLETNSHTLNIMNSSNLGDLKYLYNIKMAGRLPRYISINTNNTISNNARKRIRRSLNLNFRGVSKANQKRIIMETAKEMRGGTRNFRNETFAYRYLARDYNSALRRVRSRIIKQRKDDAKKNILTFRFRVKIYKVYQSNKVGVPGQVYLAANFVVTENSGAILKTQNSKWVADTIKKLKNKYEDSPNARVEVKSEGGNAAKVQTPIPANEVLMQYVGVMNLDGLIDNAEWYKEDNHCVPDLLQFRYGKTKGLIKPTRTRESIEFWSTHIKDDYEYDGYSIDYELEEKEMMKPNENGYSALNIKRFCENWGINMYALMDEEVIEYCFHEENKKKLPSLVFEIKNNHIYPILDKRKIKSITNKPKKTLEVAIKSSTEMEAKEADEEEEVEDDGTEVEFIDTGIYDECNTQMEYACEIMSRDNNMIYGNNGKSLVLYNGKMSNFKLGDKKYLMIKDVIPDEECETPTQLIQNKNLRVIKDYCEQNGEKYVGQTAPYFMRPFVKEFTKHTYSYFSRDVFKVLSNPKVKARTHWGKPFREFFHPDEENALWDYHLSYDINKCYRSVMEDPFEEWYSIGFEREIEEVGNPFPESVEPGLYYVKTYDNSLFHYSNWYSASIINYAISLPEDQHIHFEVLYKIGVDTRGKECLKEIIDSIKNTFNHAGLSKQVINCLYGYMMKTHNTTTMMRADEDINQIWNTYAKVKGKKNEKLNLDCVETKNGKKIWFYGIEKLTKIMNNNLPIGIQITDMANIKLHKMIKDMTYDVEGYKVGTTLFRNTDCAVVGYTTLEHYTHQKHKMDNLVNDEIGGYSPYIVNKENCGFERRYEDRTLSLCSSKFDIEWNDIEGGDSDRWLEIIGEMIDSGGGQLLGRAGTGKSYVCINGMKSLREYCDIKCKALAFTNKATIQLNGSTIHKFMTIDKNGKLNTKWAREQAKNIDVIFIDEISMISSDLWKILAEFKYYTNCIFILIGDYRQLPPVLDSALANYEKEDWFNHSTIKWLCNYNRCELDVMKRYDIQLWNLLEEVWSGKHSLKTMEFLSRTSARTIEELAECKNICYMNKTRKIINSMVQDHLCPDEFILEEYKGQPSKYHQHIKIFEGAKFLMNMTTKCKTFKKNEEVSCVSYTATHFTLTNGTEELEIEYKKKGKCKIHKIILLGYATTIHKSQGDTIEGIVNVFDLKFIDEWLCDKRALYTGLSRAKSIKNIRPSTIF